MENEVKIMKGYYDNGQLQDEWPILNGVIHGTQKSWWSNGNKYYEFVCVHGTWFGMRQHWNENGSIKYFEIWGNFKSIQPPRNLRITNTHGVKIHFKYGK